MAPSECFTSALQDRAARESSMYSLPAKHVTRMLEATAALVLLAFVIWPLQSAQAAGNCAGTNHEAALELVRATTDKLFAAVKAEDGPLSENPVRARALVEEFITPHVDLEGFSKLVLGKYWRQATKEQRKQFLDQFHTLILRTYGTAVTSYTGIEIEYQPMREETRENFATVRTSIPSAGGEGVKVNYRLHCRDNVWRVFDVSIAGVSMVTTYRTAFSAEVKRSGLDGLIKVLEQKNSETGTS
jgi:phospholipid transport system substrate-binding protein